MDADDNLMLTLQVMREARQQYPVVKYHCFKSEGVILAAFFMQNQETITQQCVMDQYKVKLKRHLILTECWTV